MKNKAFLVLAVTLFAAFGGFLGINQAFAQNEGVSIKISPTRFEELVEPGQILEEKLMVTNESPNARTLYPYLKDFKTDGESGAPLLIAPGSESGSYLASWVDINASGVLFQPGEEKTIDFRVSVPNNVGPGGYYGGVFFGTEPPKIKINSEDKGAGMAIGQQTGALLLFQVKGQVNENAQVREFNSDKDLYGTPFEVKFTARIENNGNVHIKPYGMISIKNMFGREVGVVKINDQGGNVLPKSIRRFDNNWKDKMGFGRYVAQLGLTYGTSPDKGGQGMQTMYSEKIFWIMPWRIIVPTILILIILISLFVLFLKYYKNKAVKKAMKQAGFENIVYPKLQRGQSPVMHFALVLLTVFVVLFLVIVAAYFLFFA